VVAAESALNTSQIKSARALGPDEMPERPYTFDNLLKEPRKVNVPWSVRILFALMVIWWAFEFGRALNVW
jgi:hypothetical protein